MASTYSPLKIELITTGEQSGTWGSTTNVNLGTALEEAITGSADVTFASANVTLTLTNTNGTQTARNLRLRLTGTTAGARNLIVPAIEKQYIIQNDTADTITVKNSTGTGVAIPTTMSAVVFNDGVNVSCTSIYSTSVVTPLLVATDAAFVNPLAVTSGGTGVTTATGTGSVVRATSPTLTTPALGTPTSGNLANCTFPTLNQNTTGNAATATLAANASSISSATGGSYQWTSTNNFLGSNNTSFGGQAGALAAYGNSGGTNAATMSFHRPGAYAINMGLDADNVFRIGGWSAPANLLQMNMSGNLTMAGTVAGTNITSGGNVTGNAATVTNGVYTTTFTGENQSFTNAGFQRLPGGLIIQWGRLPSMTNNQSVDIIFYLNFPNGPLSFVATAESNNGGDDVAYSYRALTSGGCTVTLIFGSAPSGRYIALGY